MKKITAKFVFSYDMSESYNEYINDLGEGYDIEDWVKDSFDGHDFNDGAMDMLEVIVGEPTITFTEDQKKEAEHLPYSALTILELVEDGMLDPNTALIRCLGWMAPQMIDEMIETLPVGE